MPSKRPTKRTARMSPPKGDRPPGWSPPINRNPPADPPPDDVEEEDDSKPSPREDPESNQDKEADPELPDNPEDVPQAASAEKPAESDNAGKEDSEAVSTEKTTVVNENGDTIEVLKCSIKPTDAASPGAARRSIKRPTVRSFSSPKKKKKDSNPYNIHFVLVNRKLFFFYFSRERFGNDRTYANHLMKQATLRRPPWVDAHNISDDELFYHINGVIQKHFDGSRYNKRLFFINEELTFETNEEFAAFARPIAKDIETNLNQELNKDSRVSVPASDSDLIQVLDDGVFADIAGREGAMVKLLDILGEDYKTSDFNDNTDLIYTFFRPGQIPRAIGPILGASEADMVERPIYNE